MDIIAETSPKRLTSETSFSKYLLIVNAYSKIPKLYGMEIITTEEVMDKLDILESIFGKIDEFGWWSLKVILVDAGRQFISMKFLYECQTRNVHLKLADPWHQ